MSRQRTRKPAVGSQLFPFLAVLICTTGALIVLLVLFVSQTRVRAEAFAENRSQQQAQSAERKQMLETQEDLDWRQQVLAQQRQELQQRLADQRQELSHLEEHIRRLEQTLGQLQLQADQWRRLGSGRQQDQAAVEADLARLQAEIDQERQRLAEAREEASKKRRSFAIIVYRGPHGTKRRPIYLECRATGIVIRPEGITLTPDDLAGPLGPGNPLDAALRAICEHWTRSETAARGEQPYPLLIVRPDGAVAYSVARAAMKSWEDEFGYELVDADMELTFPPSDPSLRQIVENSIATARQRQALLVAAMPSRFESSLLPRQPAGGGGGGGGGEGWGPTRSVNSTGTPSAALGFTAGSQDSTGLAQGYGRSSSATGFGAGGATGGAAGRGAPYESTTGGASPIGYNSTAAPALATANPNHGPPTGPNGAGGGPGGVGGGAAGGNSDDGNSSIAGPGGGGPSGGQPGGGSSGAARSGAAGPSGGFDARGGGSSASMASNSAQAPGGSRGSTERQRGGSQSTAGDGGESAQQSGPDFSSTVKSAPKTFDVGPSVSQRKPPDATGITRPIQVECHPDRLVILPDQGTNGTPQIVPLQGTMRKTFEPLATALRTHMDRWGLAVAGGYWKPVIRVRVMPGAETQFEQLRAVLESNGMDVQKKEEPRRYRTGAVSLPS